MKPQYGFSPSAFYAWSNNYPKASDIMIYACLVFERVWKRERESKKRTHTEKALFLFYGSKAKRIITENYIICILNKWGKLSGEIISSFRWRAWMRQSEKSFSVSCAQGHVMWEHFFACNATPYKVYQIDL